MYKLRTSLFAVAALAAAVMTPACGGKSLDLGFDDSRVDTFDPTLPVDMGAVRARCDAGGGTDVPFTTDAASRTLLAGRWFLCETSGDPGMALPAAMEFTADGAWYALVADGSNVYSRDVTRMGTYTTSKDVSCCYPDTLVVAFAAAGFYVVFRSGPRQMLWASSASQDADPRPTVARFVKG